jgi:flavorubredoxin
VATVDEIAPDIFRINVMRSGAPITFSFFLIRGEESVLIETSFGQVFDELHQAVASLVDPATLRHIVVPHFEADECGALNQFLTLAPRAEAVCSRRGVSSLLDFTNKQPRAVQDGETIAIGDKRLRFLITPYVHTWDSLLVHEETTGTLFSSDLFMQPGNGPAVTDQDLTDQMVSMYRQIGIMPSMAHLHAALEKIDDLDVQRIACHHGSTLHGSVVPRYVQALRDNDVTAVVTA